IGCQRWKPQHALRTAEVPRSRPATSGLFPGESAPPQESAKKSWSCPRKGKKRQQSERLRQAICAATVGSLSKRASDSPSERERCVSGKQLRAHAGRCLRAPAPTLTC